MGTGHFCQSLYVAIQVGLSLIQLELDSGVQSLRILEDVLRVFPADYLHPSHCHANYFRVARDSQTFQHMAGFY